MEVRPWDPEKDREWFDQWLEKRGTPVDQVILSPFGGVAEDDEGPIMAGFVFLAVGVGVCWIEQFTARPGCRPSQSREAGRLVLGYISELATGNDYGVAFSSFEDPRMAREAEKLGFVKLADGVVSMCAVLRPVEPCKQ